MSALDVAGPDTGSRTVPTPAAVVAEAGDEERVGPPELFKRTASVLKQR